MRAHSAVHQVTRGDTGGSHEHRKSRTSLTSRQTRHRPRHLGVHAPRCQVILPHATTDRLLRMVDSGSTARLILINRCRVSTDQPRPTSSPGARKLGTVRPLVCPATASSIRRGVERLGGDLAEVYPEIRTESASQRRGHRGITGIEIQLIPGRHLYGGRFQRQPRDDPVMASETNRRVRDGLGSIRHPATSAVRSSASEKIGWRSMHRGEPNQRCHRRKSRRPWH